MPHEFSTQAVSAPLGTAGPLWFDLPGTYHSPEDGAPAAAPSDPGGAASPAAQTATPAPAPASPAPVAAPSGGAPADEFADVDHPGFKERLSGVAKQRDELKQQMEALTPFQEWGPAIQRMSELGFTPQQIAEFQVQQQQEAAAAAPAPAPPADPDTRFAVYLTAQRGGVPVTQEWWDGLTDAEQISLRGAFDTHEWRQGQEAERAASDTRARNAELQNQLQAVQTEHPELKGPAFTAVLRLAQNQGLDTRTCATQLMAALSEFKANALAEYALSKGQDAAIPPAAGGTTPAPSAPFDVSKATAEQRQAAVEASLRALNSPS